MRYLKLWVVPLCVLLLAAFSVVDEVDQPESGTTQGVPCGNCDLGPTGYHSFGGGGLERNCEGKWGDDDCHGSPVEGHCDNHYQFNCILEDDDADIDVEELKQLASQSDLQSLVELFDRLPDRTTYNQERQAVQVAGCGSTIAFHLPVSTELALALAPYVDG